MPIINNVELQPEHEQIDPPPTQVQQQAAAPAKVICNHCLRTATNGIKCKGICVADSDY